MFDDFPPPSPDAKLPRKSGCEPEANTVSTTDELDADHTAIDG